MRVNVMKQSCKLAGSFLIFLLAASLSASANSKDSFSASLTGFSPGDTVAGTFSFNSKTDEFSKISVSFMSSVFGDVKASDPNSVKGIREGKDWLLVWSTQKGKDTIWYSVLFNPAANQFQASGWIENAKHQGDFKYLAVSEGGSPLFYPMLCGLAVFAGVLISRKQRRAALTAAS